MYSYLLSNKFKCQIQTILSFTILIKKVFFNLKTIHMGQGSFLLSILFPTVVSRFFLVVRVGVLPETTALQTKL